MRTSRSTGSSAPNRKNIDAGMMRKAREFDRQYQQQRTMVEQQQQAGKVPTWMSDRALHEKALQDER